MTISIVSIILFYLLLNLLVTLFNLYPYLNFKRFALIFNHFYASVCLFHYRFIKYKKINTLLLIISLVVPTLLLVPAYFSTDLIRNLRQIANLNYPFIIIVVAYFIFIVFNLYWALKSRRFLFQSRRIFNNNYYQKWFLNWVNQEFDDDFNRYSDFIKLLNSERLDLKKFQKAYAKISKKFHKKEIFKIKDYYFLYQDAILKLAFSLVLKKEYNELSILLKRRIAKSLELILLGELKQIYDRSWYVRNNKLYLS